MPKFAIYLVTSVISTLNAAPLLARQKINQDFARASGCGLSNSLARFLLVKRKHLNSRTDVVYEQREGKFRN